MLAELSAEGGAALVLARGAADASVLSAFGAPLCLLLLPQLGRRWIAGASIAAALVLTLAWAALATAHMAGSPLELPVVLHETLFGRLVLARLALLAVAGTALALRHTLPAAVAAGLAVASQAGHGHALAMWEGPSWLLLSDVLHLLAAGAWLGGLPTLALYVASAPADQAAVACRRFGRLGTGCVLVIAGTALIQSSVLIGSLAGLIGTGYGLTALAKLALFLLLLGIAARNRFRLTPALAVPGNATSRLARSIAAETAVGLLAVLAAGLLTSLAPAMHLQPDWPFAWRPSLELVSEEPEFLREVLVAGGAMLAVVALAGAALLLRWRVRWAVAALAAGVAWVAAPHLSLLFAPAYPTQFWSSPTGFSSSSIMDGAALYPAHCGVCHGPQGRGNGPAAASLPVPPADLTAAHLWGHPDGELFWWLSHGIEGPEGGLVMPGFAASLSEEQRWALIDWVRANNAGQAKQASGAWPAPVRAPGLAIVCAEPGRDELTDLRGSIVRIVFSRSDPAPGVITVAVGADATPRPGVCASLDPAAARAYATVTGLASLTGAEVLVDADGWLRSVLTDATPDRLAEAVGAIRTQSLAAAPVGHAGMRM